MTPNTSSNNSRLTRIESKLHRMMLTMGLDPDGNPANGGITLTRQQFFDLVNALDLYLNLLDTHGGQDADSEAHYNDMEELYNSMIDLRNARWKDNQT